MRYLDLYTMQDRKTKPVAIVNETETGYSISISIPGFKKEDVKIYYQNDKLFVSGEVDKERTDLLEFYQFDRTWEIHDKINTEKIEASLSDGILKIFLPFDEQKRKIEIQIQ